MTEKENMLAGIAYKASDAELVNERQRAKEILFDVNNLRPNEITKRHELLKQLLGQMGENVYFEPPFRCDYGYNLSIGDHFYANYNFTVLDCNTVTIGDHVLIGPNVSLYTAGHPFHPDERAAEWEYAKPIQIGNHVWIGGGTIINPGVTVGDNSIIGSGSVVTKDIPPNVIAVGNPCRVLRPITEKDKFTNGL